MGITKNNLFEIDNWWFKWNYAAFHIFNAFSRLFSGGSRISRKGVVDHTGGCGLLRWLRFKNFVCRNERIWTITRAYAGHAPRSANAICVKQNGEVLLDVFTTWCVLDYLDLHRAYRCTGVGTIAVADPGFPVGGVDLVGGCGLQRRLRFVKFLCQNERIGSLRECLTFSSLLLLGV